MEVAWKVSLDLQTSASPVHVCDAFPLHLKAGAPCSGLSPQPQGTDLLMGIFFPFIHIVSGFARAFLQAFDLRDSWEFSINHYRATGEEFWSSGRSTTQANSTVMAGRNVAGGGLWLAGVEAQLRGWAGDLASFCLSVHV